MTCPSDPLFSILTSNSAAPAEVASKAALTMPRANVQYVFMIELRCGHSYDFDQSIALLRTGIFVLAQVQP
jgi:hypothetical protein